VMWGSSRRSRVLGGLALALALVATPAAAEVGSNTRDNGAAVTRPLVTNVAERGERAQSSPPTEPPPVCFERRVFVLGDSLMLGSVKVGHLDELLTAGDYLARIDARQSRFADGGATRLRREANDGRLEPLVLVALGTNDATAGFTTAWFAEYIDAAMTAVGPARTVLWLNLQVGDERLTERFNNVLAYKAVQYPNLFVLDWAATPNRQFLADDGIHDDHRGYVNRAAFIKDRLDYFTCRRPPF
jgi:hypothetical protein